MIAGCFQASLREHAGQRRRELQEGSLVALVNSGGAARREAGKPAASEPPGRISGHAPSCDVTAGAAAGRGRKEPGALHCGTAALDVLPKSGSNGRHKLQIHWILVFTGASTCK